MASNYPPGFSKQDMISCGIEESVEEHEPDYDLLNEQYEN